MSGKFDQVQAVLDKVLESHSSKVVGGCQIGLLTGDGIEGYAAGLSSVADKAPLTPATWLELCSLSKTIGVAFAIDYLAAIGIHMSARVNVLLARYKSPFRLIDDPTQEQSKGWADTVCLRHLVNHTGLGMHYVYGTPLTESIPSVLEVMAKGKVEIVTKPPGTIMKYSGGGFLLLQHLLEQISGSTTTQLYSDFFRQHTTIEDGGVPECSFDQCQNGPCNAGTTIAIGYDDNGEPVPTTRLMFPPLAAGALGSSRGLAMFLRHLALAYNANEDEDENGSSSSSSSSGGISRTTARQMLNRTMDCGAQEFMAADVGLGVFVITAGESRFMIHQAANEGFRGLYCVCFSGPEYDKYKGPTGFVALANGDNMAVPMLADVSVALLRDVFQYEGFDFSRQNTSATSDGISQEQIVNQLLKEMVFKAAVNPIMTSPSTSSTDIQDVKVEQLTSTSFREFGDVLCAPRIRDNDSSTTTKEGYITSIVNDGTALKYSWLIDVVNQRTGTASEAKVNVAVFQCQQRDITSDGYFQSTTMERHPHSAQAFIPVDRSRPGQYVVFTAHGQGSRPDMRTLRAYVSDQTQGFCYMPGVWHSPMVVLGTPMVFLCLTYEDRTADDCHVVSVARPFRIRIPGDGGDGDGDGAGDGDGTGVGGGHREDGVSSKEEEGNPMEVAPMTPAPKTQKDRDAERAWKELCCMMSYTLGARVRYCTDDWFAYCENMLSDSPPLFIPGKFTAWGKWMDGWESRRKRRAGHDWCIVRLARPALLYGFEIDTAFFTGNQTPAVSIQAACIDEAEDVHAASWSRLAVAREKATMASPGGGFAQQDDSSIQTDVDVLATHEWCELLSLQPLAPGYEDSRHHAFDVPHSLISPDVARKETEAETAKESKSGGKQQLRGWTHLRINMWPDGGIARIKARGAVVLDIEHAECDGEGRVDLAHSLNGGVGLGSSNAHYGRASNLIAPHRAVHMDGGWETARNPNRPHVLCCNDDGHMIIPDEHVDWAIVRLACAAATISRIEVDTNHFKGNCPESCQIDCGRFPNAIQDDLSSELQSVTTKTDDGDGDGDGDGGWKVLLKRTQLKPHQRHFFDIADSIASAVARGATHVRIKIFPDGGVSRLRIWGTPSTVTTTTTTTGSGTK